MNHTHNFEDSVSDRRSMLGRLGKYLKRWKKRFGLIGPKKSDESGKIKEISPANYNTLREYEDSIKAIEVRTTTDKIAS